MLLQVFGIGIGRRFDALLDAVDFAIHLVVLVEQAGEVGIGGFELVNPFAVFGQLVDQVMRFTEHGVPP